MNRVASGRGIACVLYEGDNGYCAMVADVDVHLDTGVVDVKRIVMAVDAGPISNPDGLRNQCEGGALHGLSRALFEEVTWDHEKVTSVDWRTYQTFPVGFKVPTLQTVLVNAMEAEANGAGEVSITVTAAAIGNAIFDATGVRLREVPFTPERRRRHANRKNRLNQTSNQNFGWNSVPRFRIHSVDLGFPPD